jgi:hypothetical protein
MNYNADQITIDIPNFIQIFAELTNYGWDEYVWATCLAITALATLQDFKDQKDLWELIANKAQKWLAQQVPDASILQGIIKTAEFCLHK